MVKGNTRKLSTIMPKQKSTRTKRTKKSSSNAVPRRPSGMVLQPPPTRASRLKTFHANPLRSWSDVVQRLQQESGPKKQKKKSAEKPKHENSDEKPKENVEELVIKTCKALLESLRVSDAPGVFDTSHLSPLSDLCETPDISDAELSMYDEMKEADDEEVPGSTSLALLLSHFNSEVVNYEDLMELKRGDEGFFACFHDWLTSETVGEAGTHVYASDNQPINITTMYNHMDEGNQLLDLRARRLCPPDQ